MSPPTATETWTCRAPRPVALADALVLRQPGRRAVNVARGRTAAGTRVWRCAGGDTAAFAIEERAGGGVLVTRPDGVPFGRVVVTGRVLPRLHLHDHERRLARVRCGRHVVVDDTGATIAWLSRTDDGAVLEVAGPVNDTLWALLVATLLYLPAGPLRRIPRRPG